MKMKPNAILNPQGALVALVMALGAQPAYAQKTWGQNVEQQLRQVQQSFDHLVSFECASGKCSSQGCAILEVTPLKCESSGLPGVGSGGDCTPQDAITKVSCALSVDNNVPPAEVKKVRDRLEIKMSRPGSLAVAVDLKVLPPSSALLSDPPTVKPTWPPPPQAPFPYPTQQALAPHLDTPQPTPTAHEPPTPPTADAEVTGGPGVLWGTLDFAIRSLAFALATGFVVWALLRGLRALRQPTPGEAPPATGETQSEESESAEDPAYEAPVALQAPDTPPLWAADDAARAELVVALWARGQGDWAQRLWWQAPVAPHAVAPWEFRATLRAVSEATSPAGGAAHAVLRAEDWAWLHRAREAWVPLAATERLRVWLNAGVGASGFEKRVWGGEGPHALTPQEGAALLALMPFETVGACVRSLPSEGIQPCFEALCQGLRWDEGDAHALKARVEALIRGCDLSAVPHSPAGLAFGESLDGGWAQSALWRRMDAGARKALWKSAVGASGGHIPRGWETLITPEALWALPQEGRGDLLLALDPQVLGHWLRVQLGPREWEAALRQLPSELRAALQRAPQKKTHLDIGFHRELAALWWQKALALGVEP